MASQRGTDSSGTSKILPRVIPPSLFKCIDASERDIINTLGPQRGRD